MINFIFRLLKVPPSILPKSTVFCDTLANEDAAGVGKVKPPMNISLDGHRLCSRSIFTMSFPEFNKYYLITLNCGTFPPAGTDCSVSSVVVEEAPSPNVQGRNSINSCCCTFVCAFTAIHPSLCFLLVNIKTIIADCISNVKLCVRIPSAVIIL